MIVRRSTHEAVIAQRDRAEERANRAEAAALRFKRSCGLTLRECARLTAEIEALKAELATTYVRGPKGRIGPHPSAVAAKLESVA